MHSDIDIVKGRWTAQLSKSDNKEIMHYHLPFHVPSLPGIKRDHAMHDISDLPSNYKAGNRLIRSSPSLTMMPMLTEAGYRRITIMVNTGDAIVLAQMIQEICQVVWYSLEMSVLGSCLKCS